MKEILQKYDKYQIKYAKYEYVVNDVSKKVGNIIYYQTKADALCLTFNQNLTKLTNIKRGIMLDCSRGKVYRVATIKEFMLKSVAMGVNYFNLYLEDLIDLKQYQQYGYLRGKYADVELAEIVKLAQELEVKIYPAIQVLGHLEHFLKWEQSDDLQDGPKVLAVGKNEVYEFIDQLISKCQKIFQNEVINLGMDEAFDLGMGKNFRKTGTINQKKLYLDHLDRVVKICENHGYKTIKIWSDMLFSIYANAGEDNLYATDFQSQEILQLSASVEIIYWNYWTKDSQEYQSTIKAHRLFSKKVTMALGIHTWALPFYDIGQLPITKAAVQAIKTEKISDVLYTMWNDDGALCNLESTYLGVYESMSNLLEFEQEKVDFENLIKLNYNLAHKISNFKQYQLNVLGVIWNDPLTNIYLKSIPNPSLKDIVKNLQKVELLPTKKLICQLYNAYLNCLITEISLYLKRQEKAEILELKQDIKIVINNYEILFNLLETNFLQEAKLYGMEDLQRRFSLKLYRFKFLQKNLTNTEVDLLFQERLTDYTTMTKTSYDYLAFPTVSRW